MSGPPFRRVQSSKTYNVWVQINVIQTESDNGVTGYCGSKGKRDCFWLERLGKLPI